MQAEIIEALNAVRSAGHEFTKSFNHLSDIIEEMAKENETLHATLREKDSVINGRDDLIARHTATQESASARATKAEKDAWEMAQSLARVKLDNETMAANNRIASAQLTENQRELAELRPMRQQRDIAFADLTTANGTIASLRQEVSKLLEIILNVATSVDGVVNKPKANEVINPDTTIRADYEDIQQREPAYSEPLMDPDTGAPIPNRYYPRSAA